MLQDIGYDKVRILHDLSKLCWFLKKHAMQNAERAGDAAEVERIKQLEQDLQRHIAVFKEQMCR